MIRSPLASWMYISVAFVKLDMMFRRQYRRVLEVVYVAVQSDALIELRCRKIMPCFQLMS